MSKRKAEPSRGAATVAARVLGLLDVSNPKEIIESQLKEESGVALVALFRSLGFRVVAGEMNVANLRHLLDQRWPVVASLADRQVLVRRVGQGQVHFVDPVEGDTHDPLSAFLARWTSSDGPQFAIAVWQE